MRKGAILTKEETIPNMMGGVEERTISSLEIAEMMEMNHSDILKKLEGRKDRKGYIQILNEGQMSAVDYFARKADEATQGTFVCDTYEGNNPCVRFDALCIKWLSDFYSKMSKTTQGTFCTV